MAAIRSMDCVSKLSDEALESWWREKMDPDNTGYLHVYRLRRYMESAYRERFMLALTMQDSQRVMLSLDGLFLGFYLFLVMLIALAMFTSGNDFGTTFATLASVLLAWSFILGNTLKNCFENLVFLFYVHHFDVGDLVRIGGDLLKVTSISVMASDFVRDDGAFIRIENHILRNSKIVNLTTSENFNERLDIYIGLSDVSSHIFACLDKDIGAFIKKNPKDYTGLSLTIRAMVHPVSDGSNGSNGQYIRTAVFLKYARPNYDGIIN